MGKKGIRTSLRSAGENAIRIGLKVQRDGLARELKVAISEVKATLNSSSLD